MLLSQLRAYSDAVTAADFERLCHTATEHVIVCVGPTVDKRAHQRTAGFLKNTHCQQDHSNQMYITNLVLLLHILAARFMLVSPFGLSLV